MTANRIQDDRTVDVPPDLRVDPRDPFASLALRVYFFHRISRSKQLIDWSLEAEWKRKERVS